MEKQSHLFILALLLSEIPFKPNYIAATHPTFMAIWFLMFSVYVWVNRHTVVHIGKRKEVTEAAQTLGTKGTEGRERTGAQQKGR